MILGDPTRSVADGAHGLGAVSISELFHYAARRRPEALALADPANRSDFTDGKPRRLSYADADRTVAAIAARLRGMGLPTDAVIGIQLPNTVENILAMLGVLRAGMIAAPLPLLWRRADTVTALARIGAKALIVCGRVGANRALSVGAASGGGSVFDPLRLRFRSKLARWCGVVRRSIFGRRIGPFAAA